MNSNTTNATGSDAQTQTYTVKVLTAAADVVYTTVEAATGEQAGYIAESQHGDGAAALNAEVEN